MLRSGCVGIAVALVVSACAPAAPDLRNRPGVPVEYRIGAPDELLITVRPEPGISRPVVVRPDGKISFDLIGEVAVEGKTVAEVREEIYRRIQDFIVAPDVTVTLEGTRSRRYYVFGEVNRIGSYPLMGRVTAVEGLAMAGGGTRLAALNQARLSRPATEGPSLFPIRYADITQNADATTNYELQPGDVIYVPPSISGRIGYALQIIFFPLQQIVGLGGTAVRTSSGL